MFSAFPDQAEELLSNIRQNRGQSSPQFRIQGLQLSLDNLHPLVQTGQFLARTFFGHYPRSQQVSHAKALSGAVHIIAPACNTAPEGASMAMTAKKLSSTVNPAAPKPAIPRRRVA
jgi:hypothetical protein